MLLAAARKLTTRQLNSPLASKKRIGDSSPVAITVLVDIHHYNRSVDTLKTKTNRMSTSIYLCPSVYLSIYLSACLSVCLSIYLSLDPKGRWGTTDDLATSCLNLCLPQTSVTLSSSPVLSDVVPPPLPLSPLPCRFPHSLARWSLPSRMIGRHECPYHFSFRLFAVVRSS